MTTKFNRRKFAMGGVCASLPLASLSHVEAATSEAAHSILIATGPSKHPPGTHEVPATGRLLKHCIDAMKLPGIQSVLLSSWPNDSTLLERAQSIVFVGDQFPAARMDNSTKIMSDLSAMMKRGCGIVCIHYATGLNAQDVDEQGNHPLLDWIGGYFATKCKHHQSVARVFSEATIVPSAADHEILRGWKSFTLHDEPYIKNFFGETGLRPGVVALATSKLPPEDPQDEVVAWATERGDGGRGVGIVMPHFFRNWRNDDMRKFIMNSIAWSARQSIPSNGIDVELPDLARFEPESVEPISRSPK